MSIRMSTHTDTRAQTQLKLTVKEHEERERLIYRHDEVAASMCIRMLHTSVCAHAHSDLYAHGFDRLRPSFDRLRPSFDRL